MKIDDHVIAVCSWSLQPTGTQELVEKLRTLGVGHVQLMLLNLVQLDDKRKYQELGHLRAANIQFSGGMLSFPGEDYATIDAIRKTGGLVPDDSWPLRKRIAQQAAKLAQELGMKQIGTHVGFVPPKGNPGYLPIVMRVREIATMFSDYGIELLMETGQERAEELLDFLHDVNTPNVHINFDPANMILYGAGDPIAAIRTLGPQIRHVHVKDATESNKPGVEWGEEVPFGTGQVNPSRFLHALKEVHYTGPLAIEREAGTNRVEDVRTAIESLRSAEH